MDREMLRDTALLLRRRARLQRPSYSTRAIVAASFPALRVTGRRLPRGTSEIVSRAEQVVVYERNLSVPEQRLAIAHALSHLMFDEDFACGAGHTDNLEIEERADWFAAELLLPMADLDRALVLLPSTERGEHELFLDHVDEIAADFRVPARVVRQRIDELILFGIAA